MKMKKFAIIALLIILSVAMVFGLASCKNKQPDPTPTPTPTLLNIEGVTMADASYPYDGEAKTIAIAGTLPDGATVTYAPNNTFTEPGVYTVQATVSAAGYNDLVLKATLTIVGEEEITTATVKFNSNGGPNLSDGQEISYTVDIGSVITAPTTPMFRTGYTFSGWYVDGAKWNFSTPITGDVTLTAEWDLTQYTVTYHVGVGAENPNNFYSYNFQTETYTLLAPTAADGNAATFKGWYVLDGDTKVTITEVKQGSTGNLDIYADFDYAKHDITYVLNAIGVTNHANNPTFSTIGSEEIFLYDLSAVGYVFQGWYSDASLADEYKITHIPAAISAPYTVYAKWEKTVYDITYTGVTAAETPEINTFTVEDTVVLENPTERPGFRFKGWKDASGNVVTTIPQGTSASVTLEAVWESATYTIEYDLANGTAPSTANPTTYTITSADIVLNNPTRAHYTFAGWVDEFGNDVTTIVSGSYGDIKLTAKWTAVEYTVTYAGLVAGAVTDKSNPTTITADNYDSFTLKDIYAPGYRFEGWYDAENGGNKITTFAAPGDVTVYARFTKLGFSVTYHLAGGVNNAANIHGYNEGDAAFTLLPATKPGYTFLGWYDAENGGTQVTEITGAKNFTVYARFVQGTAGLKYREIEGGLEVTGYEGTEEYVLIPSEYNGKAVIEIGVLAFFNNSVVKEVVISSGIREIGVSAFASTNLTTIIIPASVSIIGNDAFYDSDIEKIYCCVQNKPEGYADDWNLRATWTDGESEYIPYEFGYGQEIVLPPQKV